MSKRKVDGEQNSRPSKKAKKARLGSEFHVVDAALTLSVAPVFANNPRAGVEEMLDSMVMRYTTLPPPRDTFMYHALQIYTCFPWSRALAL